MYMEANDHTLNSLLAQRCAYVAQSVQEAVLPGGALHLGRSRSSPGSVSRVHNPVVGGVQNARARRVLGSPHIRAEGILQCVQVCLSDVRMFKLGLASSHLQASDVKCCSCVGLLGFHAAKTLLGPVLHNRGARTS